MNEPVETWQVRIEADTGELQRELAAAAAYGRQFGRTMTTAFQSVTLEGKSVTATLRTLALDLSRLTLRAAFKPLEQSLGGMLQNLVTGGIGSMGGTGPGLPVPFAAGGVISSPISFPLAGGSTGLAGERGAEAIMPLTRGSDGRLGVKADGAARTMNVTFHVTTPDADSFRRTETQIAAMLSRAVAQGQRNL